MRMIILKTCSTAFLSLFLLAAQGQVPGCTDPLATNYNVNANLNDGSCLYDAAVVNVEWSRNLPAAMVETSGLIIFNDRLWTHNDDTDIHLYAFKPETPEQYEKFELTGTANIDWEELQQDEDYLYIGDFGNNARGNRSNLRILRVEKQSLLANNPTIDTIHFTYELQTSLEPAANNTTDFDCEAFVVTADSIYLFTKEWTSEKTSLYALPKIPGSYEARFIASYDVQGLITGAAYVPEKRVLVLSGYSSTLQPFLYLFYDFRGVDFFGGNKRKVLLNLPLHQVEAIATTDGLTYYLTNEKFTFSVVTTQQKLHMVDLAGLLGDYISSLSMGVRHSVSRNVLVWPNPATDHILLQPGDGSHGAEYLLTDLSGRTVKRGILNDNTTRVSLMDVLPGVYLLKVGNQSDVIRIVIQ